jgi:hypothetical protein
MLVIADIFDNVSRKSQTIYGRDEGEPQLQQNKWQNK